MEIFYSIKLKILSLFFVMVQISRHIVNDILERMNAFTEYFIMMLRH